MMRSLLFLAIAACSASEAPSVSLARDVRAPEGLRALSVLTADGRPATLDELASDVTVLAFWSVSCAPCLEELPHVGKLAASYHTDPRVAVLAVNVDDPEDRPAALAAAKDLRLALPIVIDHLGEVAARVGGIALPTIAVVDRDFRIHREVGFDDDAAATFVADHARLVEAARRRN